jgi:hypothetical protein
MDARALLERALLAEELVEGLRERIADLELRVRGAIGADPTTASRALSWVGRAELSENLLIELMRRIDQGSIDTGHFPAGWVARCRAQMKAVEVLRRDQAEMAEPPSNPDAYWTTGVDRKGRRTVVRDRTR